jgi:hypothetical protein
MQAATCVLPVQVAAVLEAAACYLQDHVLDSFPCPVLRVALDLQLSSLAEHIERDFLQVGWRGGQARTSCTAVVVFG